MPSRSRTSDASPGPSPRHGASQPLSSDRREELRTKQLPPASPRINGGFSRRQSSSCSNSPIKGLQSSSLSKKTIVAPGPPLHAPPRRLLPTVTQAGRRSPHSSSPRSPHHHGHGPRSPRTSHGPRSNGHGHRGWASSERQEPEEEGLGYNFQILPNLDPQKEQDLYRSFEAEFLANTGQRRGGPSRPTGGGALQLPASSHPQQGVGVLPDLRESKRTNPRSSGGLEDTLAPLHGHSPGGLSNGGHAEPERWGGRGGGLRKLPAISSSIDEGELLSSLPGRRDSELGISLSHAPSQLPFHRRSMNGGGHVSGALVEVLMESQQGQLGWGSGPEGDVPLEDHQPSFPYDLEGGDPNDDLPPPESCPSPIPLPPSEDCSFQEDSSSESSSMCFSLSESRSEYSPPPPPLANGDAVDGGVVFRPKRAGKKADRVPSIYKLKLRPRIRPRTDNRPGNSPSRIPTPVSYRDLQARGNHTPLQTPTPPQSPQSSHSNDHSPSRKAMHQAFADLIHPQSRSPAMGNRDRSFSVESESGLDTEAWM
ncbi:unnamed protein product [Oncorhynchus mykiss]|uniref:Uncharacterized protein n=1 Tax=Oncorhynchus mykiss TaxID=8022 RepID=A0A060XNQ1_ONCMY|nr:unnamed protein product [Oncorhynchus mykiss]